MTAAARWVRKLKGIIGVAVAGFIFLALIPQLISKLEKTPPEWGRLTRRVKILLIGSHLLFLIVLVLMAYLLISMVWGFLA